tara:strand:+ start:1769 stop:2290 length:522 start_codon:yes stop_codon:yes gene_type:complete
MEKINKYQNAKIYKIINDDLPNLIYYGSTISSLNIRFSHHKGKFNNCSSKLLFSVGEPEIILIENYACNNRIELEMRETEYIKGNQCINHNTPIKILDKEKLKEDAKKYKRKYREKYREKLKEDGKKYYEQNKEKMREKAKVKIHCVCGSIFRCGDKSSHLKTKKHINFKNLK